eukprot:s5962_g3.t1
MCHLTLSAASHQSPPGFSSRDTKAILSEASFCLRAHAMPKLVKPYPMKTMSNSACDLCSSKLLMTLSSKVFWRSWVDGDMPSSVLASENALLKTSFFATASLKSVVDIVQLALGIARLLIQSWIEAKNLNQNAVKKTKVQSHTKSLSMAPSVKGPAGCEEGDAS